MKFSNATKCVSAAALALSLSVVPSMVSAQTDTNSPGTSAPADTTTNYNTEDDGFDWGWLGLLGLLGLAGLARKPAEPTAYREPDVATRSSSYRE
ncbi:MAG: WGxxGxxG family protein [Leptolyngbyaceae cyanobacterium bins.59]|nr:WGxxGxxG family protein [Leptolyngbyaceae cyanobacterium bins.59]